MSRNVYSIIKRDVSRFATCDDGKPPSGYGTTHSGCGTTSVGCRGGNRYVEGNLLTIG